MSFPQVSPDLTASILGAIIVLFVLIPAAVILPAAVLAIDDVAGRAARGVARGCGRAMRAAYPRARRVVRTGGRAGKDVLRAAGAALTVPPLAAAAGVAFVLRRGPAAGHYRKACARELRAAGTAAYRAGLRAPLRMLGRPRWVRALERSVPGLVPWPERAERPPEEFDGYQVVGVMPCRTPRSEVYLALVREWKWRRLHRPGETRPGFVVIKSCPRDPGPGRAALLRDREALRRLRALGLVLDQGQDERRRWYVMPHVAGSDLEAVARRFHAAAVSVELDDEDTTWLLDLAIQIAEELSRFNRAGLWNGAVSPRDLLVARDGVRLVDVAGASPLRTDEVRPRGRAGVVLDPLLVHSLASGVPLEPGHRERVDVFACGAVLYSLIEGSDHEPGERVPFTRPCPPALRWIVRRALGDVDDRHGSVRELLEDLRALRRAKDPWRLEPSELPSLRWRPARRRHVPADRSAVFESKPA